MGRKSHKEICCFLFIHSLISKRRTFQQRMSIFHRVNHLFNQALMHTNSKESRSGKRCYKLISSHRINQYFLPPVNLNFRVKSNPCLGIQQFPHQFPVLPVHLKIKHLIHFRYRFMKTHQHITQSTAQSMFISLSISNHFPQNRIHQSGNLQRVETVSISSLSHFIKEIIYIIRFQHRNAIIRHHGIQIYMFSPFSFRQARKTIVSHTYTEKHYRNQDSYFSYRSQSHL